MKLCLNPNWNNFDTWPLLSVSSMRLWDTGVTWLDCEKVKGQYDFTTLDKQLSAMAAHGIVDFVYTAGKIPVFYTVSDVAAFAAFVQALSAHIAANWKGTWFFEQWNEPNLKQYWTGTPDQLLAFSRAAYAILKPLGVKVLSPSGSGGTGINDFTKAYLAGSAGNPPFDIFAYHCYLGDKNPDPTSGLNLILNDIKVKKSTYGISAMETWFTEGSWGQPSTYNPALTEAQTAAWTATAIPLMTKWGVARFYHYAYNNDHGFGVLASGTPPALNLAGLTFQALLTGGVAPRISTLAVPTPASLALAPALEVPVPASSVTPAPISIDTPTGTVTIQAKPIAIPASSVTALPQIVPVPPSQVQLTISDETTKGANFQLNGATLRVTDNGAQ